MQRHIAATVEMKLPWLFAAEAKTEEPPTWQEANGADDAVSSNAFRIGVIELDDKFVRVVHGSLEDVVHGFCDESECDVRLRFLCCQYRKGQ